MMAVEGFGHFVMEARTLRGIKRRVESVWGSDMEG